MARKGRETESATEVPLVLVSRRVFGAEEHEQKAKRAESSFQDPRIRACSSGRCRSRHAVRDRHALARRPRASRATPCGPPTEPKTGSESDFEAAATALAPVRRFRRRAALSVA